MYEKRSAANMLRAVGMHPKYKGYAYVLCILEKTGMEPERLYGSAGEMYRLVEEKFGIKRAAMERCIRFAIQRTWETGNDKLKELFGAYDVCCMPTITEFLAVMTEGLCCGRYFAQAAFVFAAGGKCKQHHKAQQQSCQSFHDKHIPPYQFTAIL